MSKLSCIPKWRSVQRENFTRLKDLLNYLQIEDQSLFSTDTSFLINIPHRLVEKMDKGTIHDPLLRQFLPLKDEDEVVAGFGCDPVGDNASRRAPKLLHKYEGRALLAVSSACAMHCRYCFRREFDYEVKIDGYQEELEAISEDQSIEEVILSGGDPLSISDEKLSSLLDALEAIEHVQIIRFHTRFPIGIPERITQQLLSRLARARVQIIFVLHINHSKEVDQDVWDACSSLQRLGIPILTQTVLLKEINDDEETLYTLFRTLIMHGVIPYYLHQLDRVKGAHHFEVSTEKGLLLIESLRKRLPGYAIPSYVKEVAGATHKLHALDAAYTKN